MPKFEEFEQMVEREENDGWTDWIIPTEIGEEFVEHSISCCHCGLVHDLQFKIINVKEGQEKIEKPGEYHVVFKARQNEELTKERREKLKDDLEFIKKDE